MENTQSFNTPKGIESAQRDFKKFKKALANNQRPVAAREYNQIYQDSLLFPPCNLVNSLRDDLINYRTKNILSDLRVIANDKNKIKY